MTRSDDDAPTLMGSPATGDRRIAVIGPLHGFGLTPPQLFDFFRESTCEVFLYLPLQRDSLVDMSDHFGLHCKLRSISEDLLSEEATVRLIEMLESDRVDTALLAMRDYEASSVAIALSTNASHIQILYLSPGSTVLPSETAAWTILAQFQIDQQLNGSELRSAWSGRPLSSSVLQFPVFYDSRGFRPLEVASDFEIGVADQFFFSHGRLVKFQSIHFLETVRAILEKTPGYSFVLMGSGTSSEIRRLGRFFKASDLAERFVLLPHLSYGQGANARDNDGLKVLWRHLRRAGAYLDPWPCGGGSSLAEAYLAGAPVVRLATPSVTVDLSSSNQRWVDLPFLDAPLGVAESQEEYAELACLLVTGGDLRDELLAQQGRLVNQIGDSSEWWLHLLSRLKGA